MDISIFLAKALSVYFFIFGMAMILRRNFLQQVLIECFENKPCMFIFAFLSLVIGILLVIAHPSFTKDWRSVITVLAWLSLLKGLAYLFFMEKWVQLSQHLLSKAPTYYVSSIICLLLAIYLGYHGFVW